MIKNMQTYKDTRAHLQNAFWERSADPLVVKLIVDRCLLLQFKKFGKRAASFL
jgi:hypothetical protein